MIPQRNSISNYKQNILENERHSFIDKACGISILLVVYGHIYFPETIKTDWYINSHAFIYKFHMPMFMCISGYLAFLSTSKKSMTTKADYLDFQNKKLRKFLPVYLLGAASAIFLDIFYKHLPAEELHKSIFNAVFIPASSTAAFIWYLYVLYGFYLITPFLLKFTQPSLYLLLFFGFLLTGSSFSPLFSIDLFCKYFFFFLGGGIIYLNRVDFISFLDVYGKKITLFTIGLLIFDAFNNFVIPFQLISIVVILSVLFISNLKWGSSISKIFTMMGVSSFALYILNGPVLNLYYVFFKSVLKMPIDHTFIFSALFIAVGVSILFKIVFNKLVPRSIYSL